MRRFELLIARRRIGSQGRRITVFSLLQRGEEPLCHIRAASVFLVSYFYTLTDATNFYT